MLDLEDHIQRIAVVQLVGRVNRIVGMTIAVAGFPAPLGAIAKLEADHGATLEAEVIGFSGEETLLLPYDELHGVRRGTRVSLGHSVQRAKVGQGLLGRMVNGRGQFIDHLPVAILPDRVCLHQKPISPMSRPRIDEPLATGVRAIDGLLTMGKGQRLGIFSGSGVGKSTLLGQIARSTEAAVNVVILIGERGREVRDFIERDLGTEGLSRSVVIVATSDDPAILRLRAAYLGTAIAEYFRDTGRDVLLMVDSVTRFAQAQREIGLAAGEPPATRGNPPSVFAQLPKLLERCGRTTKGSISGFYTVLVEGDDTNEPISDTVRGILDGHIILSRALAEQSHFPAVDVLGSISRLMPDTTGESHRQAANSLRQLLAARRQADDLISIGAYQAGANPVVDAALRLQRSIESYLRQATHEHSSLAETINRLEQLAEARGDR